MPYAVQAVFKLQNTEDHKVSRAAVGCTFLGSAVPSLAPSPRDYISRRGVLFFYIATTSESYGRLGKPLLTTTMELNTYDSPSSPSFKYHQPTSTTHYNPFPYPDDLAKLQTLEPWSDTPPKWYYRITIPLPLLYGFHFLGVLVFGLVTLLLGLLGGGYRKNITAFWDLCPEFIAVTITLCVLVLVHQVFLPRFWRRRARELVQTGAFSPRGAHQDSKSGFAFSNIVQGGGGGGKVVLEIGCNDGSTSAIFAREILLHQGDVANLSAPSAYLPTFVGYDRWSKWSRIPNGPKYFLSTLMK
ncbi:hypothetical protein FRC17_007960, partial [Serendipita sp. 399]